MNALRPLLAASAVALLVPLAGAVLPAAAGAATADDATVVATVNGEPVTLGEMRALQAGMGEQAEGLPAVTLWDMLLDQLTGQLAMTEAGKADLTARDEAALTLQRRAYIASLALERIAAPAPAEDELKAAYGEAYGNGEGVEEYSAQHILVNSEEAAEAVEADLAAGKDFGQVAEERSTGPSGPNKGDLGWFTLDMMVPPFAEAVAALKKGEVSPPVETQFGWHVIRLNDTRMKKAPAFDEVREELAQKIRRDRVEAAVREVLDAAKIEKTPGLDPQILKGE